MNLLGDNLSFVLLVLFGMFAVGVHSYNLYGKRVAEGEKDEKPHFLDSLSLQTLGSRSSYLRGFLFYLAINELIYLTLSFSTLILQQSLHFVGKEEMVGALTSDIRINPLYPILASSVIILASQMKPLSDVENAIRRMAHAIAGIPRALFVVQQRIKAQSIEELVTNIDDSEHAADLHELVDNAESLADKAHDAARAAGMPPDELSTLKKSLVKMHCLHSWTLGYYGEKIWSDERTRPINLFFQSMKMEKRQLSEKTSALQQASTTRAKPKSKSKPIPVSLESPLERWRDVALECRGLENRLSNVLGLMLINKPDADLQAYPTLRRLRSEVNKREVNTNMNAFSLAVLQGWSLAIAALFLFLSAERGMKEWIRNRSSAGEVLQLEPLLSTGVLIDAPAVAESWSASWQTGILDAAGLAGTYLNRSIEEVMEPALIFLVAVSIALSMRALQRINRSWPSRNPDMTPKEPGADGRAGVSEPPPVTTYLYIGACAYLLTCAVVLSYRYLVMVVLPAVKHSLSLEEAAQLVEFTTYIPEIFLISASAFVCVWYACAYLDLELWRELHWVHPSAFTMALLCGGLNLIAAVSTKTIYTGWELPAAFLSPWLVYSAFFVRYARVMKLFRTVEPKQINLYMDSRQWLQSRASGQSSPQITGAKGITQDATG